MEACQVFKRKSLLYFWKSFYMKRLISTQTSKYVQTWELVLSVQLHPCTALCSALEVRALRKPKTFIYYQLVGRRCMKKTIKKIKKNDFLAYLTSRLPMSVHQQISAPFGPAVWLAIRNIYTNIHQLKWQAQLNLLVTPVMPMEF